MKISKKQEILLDLLEWILPDIRNIQSQTSWWRIRRKISSFEEAELVHNLPPLLRDPEFGIDDVRWMGSQLQNYCRKGESNRRHLVVADCAKALLEEMPEELRRQVNWTC